MSLNFKRHYSILIVLVVVVSVLTLALGDLCVIAYTTRAEPTSTTKDMYDFTNEVDLLDDTVVHSIQVIMSEADYDSMITTYQQTGLKEYFKADVIIDGVRINNVGIRLKGNASLRTALGGGGGFNRPENGEQPDAGNRPDFPNNGQPPEGFDPANRPQPQQGFDPENMPQMGGNFQMPGAGQGQERGGMGQQATSDQVKIPFMIKFDEYKDQTYQGLTAISIRNYGTSYDEALLQEPITNFAARLAGIPATETAYTGFRINDSDEKMYVVSELVNASYLAKHFENADGILYKAELGSTLAYQGEDPSSYADSFTQQTRVNNADLLPLIEFMRFLDEADDVEFEKQLPDYLDVDAFASYLAINAMLVNTDSMLGMNNNYYLYYDDETERFTILMWDANESLAKLGGSVSYDLNLTNPQQGGLAGRGAGMGGGQNALLTRFMANETFKALYEEKLQGVNEAVFASNAITEKIDEYSALIQSVNKSRSLVDIEAYDSAVESVKTFIRQRDEYLQTTGMFE